MFFGKHDIYKFIHALQIIVQGAIEWLEQNQDKTLEEITAAKSTNEVDSQSEPTLKVGEEARSLVCNECGKRFRGQAQAEYHASKTEHVDFAESTEEIAPLTETEKKAKLEELRQRLAEKRAGTSQQDKIDQKKNEVHSPSASLCFIVSYLYIHSLGNTSKNHQGNTRCQRRAQKKGTA